MTQLPSVKNEITEGDRVAAVNDQAEVRAEKDNIEIDQGKRDPIPKMLHFELRRDSKGDWNWVLWAENHRAIATNPKPYTRRNDAQRAINRMIESVNQARTVIGVV